MTTSCRALAVLAVLFYVGVRRPGSGRHEDVGSAASDTSPQTTLTRELRRRRTRDRQPAHGQHGRRRTLLSASSRRDWSRSAPGHDAGSVRTTVRSSTTSSRVRSPRTSRSPTPGPTVSVVHGDRDRVASASRRTGPRARSTLRGAELVSACVAARVNYFGVTRAHLCPAASGPVPAEDHHRGRAATPTRTSRAPSGATCSPPRRRLRLLPNPATPPTPAPRSASAPPDTSTRRRPSSTAAQSSSPGRATRAAPASIRDHQLYVNCGGTHETVTIGLQ